jgi:hypothetical protein
MHIFSLLLVSLLFLGCDDSSSDFNATLIEQDSKSLTKAFSLNTKIHLDIIEYIKILRNAYLENETSYSCQDNGVMEFTFGSDSLFPATILHRLCRDRTRLISGKMFIDENATAYTITFSGDEEFNENFFYLSAPLQIVQINNGSNIVITKATNDLTYEHYFFNSNIEYTWQEMNVSFIDYKHTLMEGDGIYNYYHESGRVDINNSIIFKAVSGFNSINCGEYCNSVNLVQLFIIDNNMHHGSVSFKEVESSKQIHINGSEAEGMIDISIPPNNYELNISKYMYYDIPKSFQRIIWKEHEIEGLSADENQALNNKLEEMGITSEEEIYQIKSQMEATMITYKSLGVTDPYIYLESHIKSLEFGQERDGLSDTGKKVLEVLYALRDHILENTSNTGVK